MFRSAWTNMKKIIITVIEVLRRARKRKREHGCKPPVPTRLVIIFRGKEKCMTNILDTQSVTATLAEVDAAGNPTTVPFDAPPSWTLSDDTFADMQVSDDGKSANISSKGKLGTFQVQVSAQAGGKPLAGTGDITVSPGAPASIAITFGTPTDKQ